MVIYDILAEKKPDILQRWFDLILSTYPSDTSQSLGSQKNPYAESLTGKTIYEGIIGIFDGLIKESDTGHMNEFIDNIIRVRAIQELEPSVAVGFIFGLKNIIRSELDNRIGTERDREELLRLESRIDDCSLAAFDIYVKCREKIYELKANEMRNWTYRVVKQSKMYKEIPADNSST